MLRTSEGVSWSWCLRQSLHRSTHSTPLDQWCQGSLLAAAGSDQNVMLSISTSINLYNYMEIEVCVCSNHIIHVLVLMPWARNGQLERDLDPASLH